MEKLKPRCKECGEEHCECENNKMLNGIILGDMLNTGIPGGLDSDFSTPI